MHWSSCIRHPLPGPSWAPAVPHLIFSWYLHVRNGVVVAAYVRLASRSLAKFQNNEIESHSGFRAHPHLRRARHPTVIHKILAERPRWGSGAGGWVPDHCYSVPYMKIPANNQVIFIKNVVAVAAYRSCRLWRWVKMPWIHDVLCDHHWTQCRHAISYTRHVASVRILEDPRWPPKCRWQDVR